MTNLDYHEPVSKLLTLGDVLGKSSKMMARMIMVRVIRVGSWLRVMGAPVAALGVAGPQAPPRRGLGARVFSVSCRSFYPAEITTLGQYSTKRKGCRLGQGRAPEGRAAE
jgi:hypothetical protein